MRKKPKTLGIYGAGIVPKLHIDKGDGKAFCGTKSKAIKKHSKITDEELNWLCDSCSRISVAQARLDNLE